MKDWGKGFVVPAREATHNAAPGRRRFLGCVILLRPTMAHRGLGNRSTGEKGQQCATPSVSVVNDAQVVQVSVQRGRIISKMGGERQYVVSSSTASTFCHLAQTVRLGFNGAVISLRNDRA